MRPRDVRGAKLTATLLDSPNKRSYNEIMTVGCGGGVSGADLGQRLTQLAFAVDMLNLEFAKVAAAFVETDEYDEQGFDSPISWIKANCHLSGGAAADRVCVGEQLYNLGQSRAALGMGEIGFAHFAHIARTAAKAGEKFDEVRLTRAKRAWLVSATPVSTPSMQPTRRRSSTRRSRVLRRAALTCTRPTTALSWSKASSTNSAELR